jgi:hypothetical protein
MAVGFRKQLRAFAVRNGNSGKSEVHLQIYGFTDLRIYRFTDLQI